MTSEWYAVVTFGGHAHQGVPRIPRGPWPSEEDANAAIGRWRERAGWMAGTVLDARCARLAGPFPTRQLARDADISDGSIPQRCL